MNNSSITKCLIASSFLMASAAHSAGVVNFLEVENDVVVFSTTQDKTGTRPDCVDFANNQLWSVSLGSDSGRAIYSLILTAIAKGESTSVTVESGLDCSVKVGVERASKVNISAIAKPVNPDVNDDVGSSDSIRLAPDSRFQNPNRQTQRIGLKYKEFTPVISLQGKHIVRYLGFKEVDFAGLDARLIIDDVLIWEGGLGAIRDEHNRQQYNYHLFDSYKYQEHFLVEKSLVVEIKRQRDERGGVATGVYNSRPLK